MAQTAALLILLALQTSMTPMTECGFCLTDAKCKAEVGSEGSLGGKPVISTRREGDDQADQTDRSDDSCAVQTSLPLTLGC
jgi:hypothetical protein